MMQTTTPKAAPKPGLSLKHTIIAALVVGAIALGVALIFYPKADVFSGILSGLVIGVVNYVFLVKIIERLVQPDGKKGAMAVLLALKMLALVGLIALAFWVLKVNVMAFAAGFMSLILVIILQNLVVSILNKN